MMRWKLILTVLVIVAIIALLIFTKSSLQIVDFLTNRVGQFISGVLVMRPSPGERFQISLSTDKSSFYGQSYRVSNSSFNGNGACQGSIKLGSLTLIKGGAECEVNIQINDGRFEFNSVGNARIVADTYQVTIDGSTYLPEDKMKVEIEMVPTFFLITNIEQETISLTATGNIHRIGSDGSIKSIENLNNDKIDISNFLGYLKYSDSTINLVGLTSSVSGQGFNW